MYTGHAELRDVYAYLIGMDLSTGCLAGFREWLVTRLGRGDSLGWPSLVDLLIAKESRSDQAILRLGELIAEFHEFTRQRYGLMRVYLRYHAWLLSQTWYTHDSTDYIAPYDGVGIMRTELRECHLIDIPGYHEWSRSKLAAGESASLIAHLDATSLWILPACAELIGTDQFEEYLTDLKAAYKPMA